jgi:hypothetical protein
MAFGILPVSFPPLLRSQTIFSGTTMSSYSASVR